jgi:hypothetical protein
VIRLLLGRFLCGAEVVVCLVGLPLAKSSERRDDGGVPPDDGTLAGQAAAKGAEMEALDKALGARWEWRYRRAGKQGDWSAGQKGGSHKKCELAAISRVRVPDAGTHRGGPSAFRRQQRPEPGRLLHISPWRSNLQRAYHIPFSYLTSPLPSK